MKKLFLISTLFILTVFTVETAQSQTWVKLKQGLVGDTIRQSTTLFTAPVNVNFQDLQALVLEVAMDSAKGTPDTKFVLQRSTDGTHWSSVAGDTLVPTYIGVNAVHPSSSKTLSINPLYATFVRVKYYTSSTTQRSKVWIAVKTSTIR